MLRTGHALLVAASLLFATLLAAGCGAKNTSHPVEPGVNPPATAPTSSAPDTRTGLPAPLSIKHGASTIQNVVLATDYLPPYVQNAVASGTDLVLTADPSQPGPAGLAYAVYSFTPDIPNGAYARVLHLTWHAAPAQDTAWLGLANFETGQWDWQVLDPTAGDTPLAAWGKNVDDTGHIAAAIVVASGSATLARVRFGHNVAPLVTLAIDKPNTEVPFDVLLEGRNVSDPEGSVADIAFDPDGSGYLDNGTTSTYTFNATQTGTFTASIKVTDDEGAVTELSRQWSSDTYYIWDGGATADNSFFMDIATLPGGGFYAAGWRESMDVPQTPELLVVKYNGSGGVEWSKSVAIDYPNGFTADCVAGPNDSVYVACRGEAGLASSDLVVLVCFSADGTVAWQEKWGYGRCKSRPSLLADNAAGTLYLSCDAESDEPSRATRPVLARLNGSDGSLLWSKTIPASTTSLLYHSSHGLAQDSAGIIYLASDGVALAQSAWMVGVVKFDTDGNLLASGGYDIAETRETLFGGGGDGPLVFAAAAPDYGPGRELLLLNHDLSINKAEVVGNADEPIEVGEINLAADNSVWISNKYLGTTLLHVSGAGTVLNLLTAQSYLPALGLAADGSLLSTGSSADGLPQWTSPATFGITYQSVTATVLDLTASNWTYPLETTTHQVSDVVPTTPPASGGLVYRFTP